METRKKKAKMMYSKRQLLGTNTKLKKKRKPVIQKSVIPALSKEVRKQTTSTVKKVTLQQSFQIQRYLNFTELFPALIHPNLKFLRVDELDRIHKLPTDTQRANELLLVLRRRSSVAATKFLACLWLTREHIGHEELFFAIFPEVPEDNVEDIVRLCKQSSSASPVKPPALIELQGDLTDTKFLKVQSHLWDLFGRGDYSRIAQFTSQLRSSPSPDWAVVGMWFEAVNCVFIHECKDHFNCVADLLKPALEKCKHSSVTNQNILEGRIYLRMSAVFLTRGEKSTAIEYSERAKELLSFTRGYDRAKLFLREAKVFSALSAGDHRKEVEKMYQFALDNFDEDHASCRPTAHLSLAAFYLHISFGSKTITGSPAPSVSDEDVRKAKLQLKAVEGEFLPSMRLCEQLLLQAEILRLEGKVDKAMEAFRKTICMSEDTKLHNLVSIAEHRFQLAKLQGEKSDFLDDLIEEITVPP
jgi:tetratricopeptide (TPR) repeat protein